jgi:hypothetical protein
MDTKKCKKCENEKPVTEFYKSKGKYNGRCKKCFGDYQRNNPNRKTNVKRYDDKNREILNDKKRERYHEDIEKSREYGRNKRTRLRKENPEHYKEYERKWKNENYERMKCCPEWKLRKTLRSRFLQAIKQGYKKSSCLKLLGCSIQEFKLYIESKFKVGMTWDNHGVFGWHIDHILPCISFDLTDYEQQKKCFHYSNMQPLWYQENTSKGSKILEEIEKGG